MDASILDSSQFELNQLPFLEHAIKLAYPVSIFLVSGLQLKGVLIGFDEHSIFLQDTNTTQMIYKHSVATIVPKLKEG